MYVDGLLREHSEEAKSTVDQDNIGGCGGQRQSVDGELLGITNDELRR